jgi:CdiI N-terminal domain
VTDEFSVDFASVPQAGTAAPLAVGSIRINSFEESFQADLSYWSAQDYQRSWRQQLLRAVSRRTDSCVITSISDPATANFIEWWLLYPRGEKVAVQNHVLLLQDLAEPFDPQQPERHIPPLERVSDDGVVLSTWDVSVEAVNRLLSRLS